MACQNFQDFKTTLSGKTEAATAPVGSSGLRLDVVKSVSDLDIKKWNDLVAGESIYLHTDYLQAMEASFGKDLEYRLVRFFESDRLVGIAAFQLTHFESGNISRNFSTSNTLVQWATKWLRSDRTFIRFKVLVCGNSFASGEHGHRFCPTVDSRHRFGALHEAITSIKASERASGNKISAILVKDFYPSSYRYARQFRKNGYSEFTVDPNMIMPLRPEWTSFEHYLDALNSKFRSKARASMRRSEAVEVRSLGPEDLKARGKDFEFLYNEVYRRAEFRMGKLNIKAFQNYFETLGERYVLKGFFLDGKMVGFISGFVYDDLLDAHFVGIDYNFNKSHGIYQRMLYEYVREGIARGCSRIAFGRTAMEIKSTVGAFPVDLRLYIRHRSKAPNALMRILFHYIKPSTYATRSPYKKEELQKINAGRLD